jgi:hypothetical protein
MIALIAIGWGLLQRSKSILLAAVFPVIYFAFIARFEVRNDRTILPLLPFLFALATLVLAPSRDALRSLASLSVDLWRLRGCWFVSARLPSPCASP